MATTEPPKKSLAPSEPGQTGRRLGWVFTANAALLWVCPLCPDYQKANASTMGDHIKTRHINKGENPPPHAVYNPNKKKKRAAASKPGRVPSGKRRRGQTSDETDVPKAAGEKRTRKGKNGALWTYLAIRDEDGDLVWACPSRKAGGCPFTTAKHPAMSKHIKVKHAEEDPVQAAPPPVHATPAACKPKYAGEVRKSGAWVFTTNAEGTCWVCPSQDCGKTMDNYRGMIGHLGRRHKAEAPAAGVAAPPVDLDTHRGFPVTAVTGADGISAFPCRIPGCTSVLTTRNNLKAHMDTVPHPHFGEEARRIGPPVMTTTEVDGHVVNQATDGTWPCPIDDCDARLKDRAALRFHIRESAAHATRLACPEDGCEATFGSESAKNRHLKKVHPPGGKEAKPPMIHMIKGYVVEEAADGRWYCPISGCSDSGSSKSNLAIHMNSPEKHGGEHRFVCDEEGCNERRTSQQNLDRHKRLDHGIGLLPCGGCARPAVARTGEHCNACKVTQAMAALKKMTNPGPRLDAARALVEEIYDESQPEPTPAAAPVVGRPCRKRISVASKEKKGKAEAEASGGGDGNDVHSRAPMKIVIRDTCAICSSAWNEDLVCPEAHYREVPKDGGGYEYPCAVSGCTYVSPKPSTAKYHANVHTGARPYPCTKVHPKTGKLCSSQFGHPSALQKHVRQVHMDIRPEVCAECGDTFYAKADLARHLLSVHDIGDNLPCAFCLEPGKVTWARGLCDDCKTDPDVKRLKRIRHQHNFWEVVVDVYIQAHGSEALQVANKSCLRDTYVPCVKPNSQNTTQRPDFLYPITKDYAVVLEVDEHEHAAYDPTCERARQDRIQAELFDHHGISRVSFVRFNPHGCDKADHIAKFSRRLVSTMEDCLVNGEERTGKQRTLQETIYLGYSESRVEILEEAEEDMRKKALGICKPKPTLDQVEMQVMRSMVESKGLGSDGSHICTLCRREFKQRNQVYRHMRSGAHGMILQEMVAAEMKK